MVGLLVIPVLYSKKSETQQQNKLIQQSKNLSVVVCGPLVMGLIVWGEGNASLGLLGK